MFNLHVYLLFTFLNSVSSLNHLPQSTMAKLTNDSPDAIRINHVPQPAYPETVTTPSVAQQPCLHTTFLSVPIPLLLRVVNYSSLNQTFVLLQ